MIYLLCFVKFLDLLNDWDGERTEASNMFMAMMLGYNLMIHFGIIPINIVIALKEISMEYF